MKFRHIVFASIIMLIRLLPVPAAAQSYDLIENFTNVLPSGDDVTCALADRTSAKVGLYAASLAYTISEKTKRAVLELPAERFAISRPGNLRLWVRGDGSGNELLATCRAAVESWDEPNKYWRRGQPIDIPLDPPLRLDFADWRDVELKLDTARLPRPTDGQRLALWCHTIELRLPQQPPAEPKTAGTVVIDDLRIYAQAPQTQKAALARLQVIGPLVRTYTTDIACSADVRNFTNRAVDLRARVSLTDRNRNLVADHEFPVKLGAMGQDELKLALQAERLGAYLPPFEIACELLSADVADLAATISNKLVMNNSRLLFDDMSDVYTRWFRILPGPVQWNQFQAEQHRTATAPQTCARISRVTRPPAPDGEPAPPGRFAMQVDFTASAAIFPGYGHFVPGNAFRLGFWVNADGGGGSLNALVMDYSDHGDFYEGGWLRTGNSPRICTLDFTGWRYFEIPLPGNGIGSNTYAGSTRDVDFPIDLCALVIQLDKPRAGSVQIGPIYALTQQELAGTLPVSIAYDDPEHRWTPAHGALVTLQNAAVFEDRTVQAAWSLLDRAGETIAEDRAELAIPAGELRDFRIDLAPHAAKIAPRLGPLRLRVTAYNKADASISSSRDIVLSKPDSIAVVQDFENDTGYFPYRSSRPAAFTTTDQAHGGTRSLLLEWSTDLNLIAIDPTIPGVPCELSMWVFGDASGAILYPLITDRFGIVHGVDGIRWNNFLPRLDGELQNAVRVDWTGWKLLTFRLPLVQANWDVPMPCERFIPNYPLGITLGVVGAKTDGGATAGKLYVDDIGVRTHVEPGRRLVMRRPRTLDSDILAPGAALELTVANLDAAAPRKAALAGGVFDWRDRCIERADQAFDLKPGEVRSVSLGKQIPPGAYLFRIDLKDGDNVIDSLEEDLIVADLRPIVGENVRSAVSSEAILRRAVGDQSEFINEDWDWVEHFPAALQTDTTIDRIAACTEAGNEPEVLLGYSAFWASGIGMEQILANRYARPLRHSGTGVDIFLVPERLDDWDIYVREIMRDVGDKPKRWVLWDRPDAPGPLAVKPDYFARMLQIVGKWRRRYSLSTPVIIGGMSRETAIPYLAELDKQGVIDEFGGVNIRVDVSRVAPEDAQMVSYVRELQAALHHTEENPRQIVFDGIDWPVEKGVGGLSVFDQAACLCRTLLLLDIPGVQTNLMIQNTSSSRLGTGLVYRGWVDVSPNKVQPQAFLLKPAWLAVRRTLEWLDALNLAGVVEVQDVVPGRTRCMLFTRKDDARPVAFVWRNGGLGSISFAAAGFSVESAVDMFGTPAAPVAPVTAAAPDGWHSVGKLPIAFVLAGGAEPPMQALRRLRVRDADKPYWTQQPIMAFSPAADKPQNYQNAGANPVKLAGRTIPGEWLECQALAFAQGGSERIRVPVADGSGLVIRKRFFLDAAGQAAELSVNGKPLGTWDMARSVAELSQGFRESIFVVDAASIGATATVAAREADIELKYTGPANTAGWCIFEYRGGDFPLSAVGAIHADQNLAFPRYARNVVGEPLAIGERTFDNGIGIWARSLVEIPLNGQFSRFTASVGVDAATDGKGSVEFHVLGDGKELWKSKVMSGLDAPRDVNVDVKGVKRLRLMVTDGGDGNDLDAADWCDPVLVR